MNVEVRVDPARTATAEPTTHYGVVEDTGRSLNNTEETAYDAWGDCWSS